MSRHPQQIEHDRSAPRHTAKCTHVLTIVAQLGDRFLDIRQRGMGAGFVHRSEHLRRPTPGQLLERSEEHTSELQSLMRISYAVFCLKKQKTRTIHYISTYIRCTNN